MQQRQQGRVKRVLRQMLQLRAPAAAAAGVGAAGAAAEGQAVGAAHHQLQPMVMQMARLVRQLPPRAHPQQQAAAGAAAGEAVVAAGEAAALQHSGELPRWLLQLLPMQL
jgi:hypothetical protein